MKTDLEKNWEAYLDGNQQAFEKVFTLLFDPLFFKVIALTKDRETAKDIVQETLIKLYQNPEPSKIRDIKSWTFKVANNLFVSEHRKAQTQKKYRQYILKEQQGTSQNPTSFPDKINLMGILKKCLSTTDFRLLQLEMKGYLLPEIAAILRMKEKTVYNRRSNIRRYVGQIWKQLFVLLILFYV